MSSPKILAFSGSLKRQSFNALTLQRAVKGAEAKGATVTLIRLEDYPLPIYGGDLAEQGLPAKALELEELIRAHDGLLIASPEHSSSLPAVLKNLFDWLWEARSGEKGALFQGKCAALVGATRGDSAALRALSTLSSILANIGVFVLPFPVGVSDAEKVFDARGEFVDAELGRRVEGVGAALAAMLLRRSQAGS